MVHLLVLTHHTQIDMRNLFIHVNTLYNKLWKSMYSKDVANHFKIINKHFYFTVKSQFN